MLEKYSIWINCASKAQSYINAIKNPHKKQYAKDYLHWLCNPNVVEPVEPLGLGYMAAQAVRWQIRDIMEVKG